MSNLGPADVVELQGCELLFCDRQEMLVAHPEGGDVRPWRNVPDSDGQLTELEREFLERLSRAMCAGACSLGVLSPSTFLPRTGLVVSSTRILDFAPFIAAEDWRNANQLSDLDKHLLRRAGKLYDFGDRVLLKGVSGEDVRQLQQYLQSTGHFSSPDGCTGYFGFQTQAAVEEWQKQNGVISTGIFGRQSREAYTRLLAIEAQKMKSRRFCLKWFSKPRIQRTLASATISQQLEVSSLSRPLVQGFPQRSFAFFLILATVLASVALASQLYKSWLKYLDDKRLQSLQHREKEAESAQLRILIRKRWEEALNADRGDPV